MTQTSVPVPNPPNPQDRPDRSCVHAALHATLLRQAGVITRAQALAVGLSPDAVDRRLARRLWHPVHPRVYRDGAFPPNAPAAVRAAVLWAGRGAVLSGAAAAWWHGMLPRPPSVIGVTVPRRRCPRPRAGVTVRRRELAGADVRTLGGIAVVAAPLAALEAAVELGGRGPALLEELMARGAVAPDAVRRAHARNLGAHGSAAAGRMLGLAVHGVRSRALRRLAVLLGAAGPSGWVRGPRDAGLPLDIAHPATRTAVTVSFPSRPGDGDPPRRDAVLHRHGWSIIVVDACDVLTSPDEVVERIAAGVGPVPTGPAGAAARAVS